MRLLAGVLLALVFLMGPLGSALAASVEFDVQPRAIRIGEAAVCSLTVRGIDNPATPQLPAVAGLRITYSGTQQSFSMVNGQTDRSVTFTYQLVPLQAGRFTLGPFAYTAPAGTFDLPGITLEVLPPDASASAGDEAQELSDLLFAVVSSSRTNLYNQQMFDLDLAVYSRGISLGGDVQLLNMPESGFRLQPFRELGSTREVVNNQIYDVRRFRARAQALTSGTFKIEPVLRVGIRTQRQRRRQDPFGMFGDSFFDDFFGNTQLVPQDVAPKPVTLAVLPLPEQGRPAGFSGAVGRFNFDMQVKPAELSAGDPITLTMQIVGDGNVENVSAPEIVSGDQFKVYEPKLVSKDASDGQSAGRKTFEQVVIPRSQDVKELPALTFAYFDPDVAAYQSITRGPFPLTVRPSSSAHAQVLQAPGGEPAPAVLLGTDIVYLKPAPTRWRHAGEHPWYLQPSFLALQSVPPIALALMFLATRRRKMLARDVARARRERAPRAARAAVHKAETAAARGDRKAFFEAVWAAMSSYFGNRLNLAPGAVALENVLEALQRGRLDPTDIERVKALFGRCEQERFGAASGGSPTTDPLEAVLEELSRVLRACERVRL